MEILPLLQRLENALLQLQRSQKTNVVGAKKDFLKNSYATAKKECDTLLLQLEKVPFFQELDQSVTKEDYSSALSIIERLKRQATMAKKDPLFPKLERVPTEIASDIQADLGEAKRCFDHECYRSAIILCGRILETALHRKYYDLTKNDLLETSPGLGLGKIIAKLKESNIELPVGLTEQIHLINHVRISSVHKKSQIFYPSKDQTHAILLFTIDAIRNLF